MGSRVQHWFNRRYGLNRRDVFLIRTETGWQVLGRQGGTDGPEVADSFGHEDDARARPCSTTGAVISAFSW
jgi:hypothetical protein